MYNRHKASMICGFLIGCFSGTQINIIGYLGISEIIMMMVGPILFVIDLESLRRDGFMPVLVLSFLWMLGAICSNWVNHIYWIIGLKGLAVPIVIFSSIVCLHRCLMGHPENLKLLLFGFAVTSVISIFIFQPGSSRNIEGDILNGADAIQSVVGYKLFWSNLFSIWLSLPVKMFYLGIPTSVSAGVVGLLAAFGLYTGARSQFLGGVISFILILIGRRDVKQMAKIKRNFVLLVLVLVLATIGAKVSYRIAATSGFMGDEEKTKYEKQTEGGKSALKILMAGRGEFFIGLIAALDHPIIGFGSHAQDSKGYRLDFMRKYGNEDDYSAFLRLSDSIQGRFEIPAHSQIISAWLWSGVLGLVFWGYIFVLFIRTLIYRLSINPSYYGYLALTLPAAFWDFFFSPINNRPAISLLIVICLFVKSQDKQIQRITKARQV